MTRITFFFTHKHAYIYTKEYYFEMKIRLLSKAIYACYFGNQQCGAI